ncbi:hypothetical protein ACFXAZ_38210, partial [Streptomyces sp. NPDC059477]|uniref:hypothetical protein n=1 Tax=Streptomyces sp. NPDC059477 TaxID=3346847 RepID=UPI00368ED34E
IRDCTEAAAFGPEDRQACVDAWAETISNRPAGFDPDTDSDAEPDACAGIPGDDWLDAYTDGLQQSNETGRNEIDECLEDPSCTSIPIG